MGALLFILIILGIGVMKNFVVNSSANYNFDFIAKNVKSEMVRVVEYDIKTSGDNLTSFINLTADYLQRSYPGVNLTFIYGTSANVTIASYTNGILTKRLISGSNVTIELNGEDYIAELYQSKQVYFAIEKIEENEAFIGFA
tara:strand:- start:188 stop:613 length:426 start_codon:yes stop_codon:yes gene_type:complete